MVAQGLKENVQALPSIDGVKQVVLQPLGHTIPNQEGMLPEAPPPILLHTPVLAGDSSGSPQVLVWELLTVDALIPGLCLQQSVSQSAAVCASSNGQQVQVVTPASSLAPEQHCCSIPTLFPTSCPGTHSQSCSHCITLHPAGKKASVSIYAHLAAKYNGSLSTAAAQEGLHLYDEVVADAKARPGAHPNIDILFDVLQQPGLQISIQVERQ